MMTRESQISQDACRALMARVTESHVIPPADGLTYYAVPYSKTWTLLSDAFEAWGAWQDARLVVVYPRSTLDLHADPPTDYQRRVVVLQTNPDAWSYHDSEWQRLVVGGVYRIDPTKPHGAVNFGATNRVHLFFDVAEP